MQAPTPQVQDTPGYGDNCSIMSNIAEMVAYVERQNMLYLRAEQDTRRAVDMCASCLPRFRCLQSFLLSCTVRFCTGSAAH